MGTQWLNGIMVGQLSIGTQWLNGMMVGQLSMGTHPVGQWDDGGPT